MFDVINRDNAADFLRGRAAQVLVEGNDGMEWRDREAAARAFNIAAMVVEL